MGILGVPSIRAGEVVVYCFEVVLLEVASGWLPFSE